MSKIDDIVESYLTVFSSSEGLRVSGEGGVMVRGNSALVGLRAVVASDQGVGSSRRGRLTYCGNSSSTTSGRRGPLASRVVHTLQTAVLLCPSGISLLLGNLTTGPLVHLSSQQMVVAWEGPRGGAMLEGAGGCRLGNISSAMNHTTRIDSVMAVSVLAGVLQLGAGHFRANENTLLLFAEAADVLRATDESKSFDPQQAFFPPPSPVLLLVTEAVCVSLAVKDSIRFQINGSDLTVQRNVLLLRQVDSTADANGATRVFEETMHVTNTRDYLEQCKGLTVGAGGAASTPKCLFPVRVGGDRNSSMMFPMVWWSADIDLNVSVGSSDKASDTTGGDALICVRISHRTRAGDQWLSSSAGENGALGLTRGSRLSLSNNVLSAGCGGASSLTAARVAVLNFSSFFDTRNSNKRLRIAAVFIELNLTSVVSGSFFVCNNSLTNLETVLMQYLLFENVEGGDGGGKSFFTSVTISTSRFRGLSGAAVKFDGNALSSVAFPLSASVVRFLVEDSPIDQSESLLIASSEFSISGNIAENTAGVGSIVTLVANAGEGKRIQIRTTASVNISRNTARCLMRATSSLIFVSAGLIAIEKSYLAFDNNFAENVSFVAVASTVAVLPSVDFIALQVVAEEQAPIAMLSLLSGSKLSISNNLLRRASCAATSNATQRVIVNVIRVEVGGSSSAEAQRHSVALTIHGESELMIHANQASDFVEDVASNGGEGGGGVGGLLAISVPYIDITLIRMRVFGNAISREEWADLVASIGSLFVGPFFNYFTATIQDTFSLVSVEGNALLWRHDSINMTTTTNYSSSTSDPLLRLPAAALSAIPLSTAITGCFVDIGGGNISLVAGAMITIRANTLLFPTRSAESGEGMARQPSVRIGMAITMQPLGRSGCAVDVTDNAFFVTTIGSAAPPPVVAFRSADNFLGSNSGSAQIRFHTNAFLLAGDAAVPSPVTASWWSSAQGLTAVYVVTVTNVSFSALSNIFAFSASLRTSSTTPLFVSRFGVTASGFMTVANNTVLTEGGTVNCSSPPSPQLWCGAAVLRAQTVSLSPQQSIPFAVSSNRLLSLYRRGVGGFGYDAMSALVVDRTPVFFNSTLSFCDNRFGTMAAPLSPAAEMDIGTYAKTSSVYFPHTSNRQPLRWVRFVNDDALLLSQAMLERCDGSQTLSMSLSPSDPSRTLNASKTLSLTASRTLRQCLLAKACSLFSVELPSTAAEEVFANVCPPSGHREVVSPFSLPSTQQQQQQLFEGSDPLLDSAVKLSVAQYNGTAVSGADGTLYYRGHVTLLHSAMMRTAALPAGAFAESLAATHPAVFAAWASDPSLGVTLPVVTASLLPAPQHSVTVTISPSPTPPSSIRLDFTVPLAPKGAPSDSFYLLLVNMSIECDETRPDTALVVTTTTVRQVAFVQQLFALKAPSLPVPIPFVRSPTTEAAGTAVGVVTVAIGGITLPIAGMQQGVALALLRMMLCNADDAVGEGGDGGGGGLDVMVHPLQFAIGDGAGSYIRGVVVGNLLIIPLAWAALAFAAVPLLLRVVTGDALAECRDTVGWPGSAIVPLALLAEGSAMASVGLLSYSERDALDIVLGCFGLLVLSAATLAWLAALLKLNTAPSRTLLLYRPPTVAMPMWVLRARWEWALLSASDAQLVRKKAAEGRGGGSGRAAPLLIVSGADDADDENDDAAADPLLLSETDGSIDEASLLPNAPPSLPPPPLPTSDADDASSLMGLEDLGYLRRRLFLVGDSWWLWSSLLAHCFSLTVGVAEGMPTHTDTLCRARWGLAAVGAVGQAFVVLTNTVPAELGLLGVTSVMCGLLVVFVAMSAFGVVDGMPAASDGANSVGTANAIIGIVLMLVGIVCAIVEVYAKRGRRHASLHHHGNGVDASSSSSSSPSIPIRVGDSLDDAVASRRSGSMMMILPDMDLDLHDVLPSSSSRSPTVDAVEMMPLAPHISSGPSHSHSRHNNNNSSDSVGREGERGRGGESLPPPRHPASSSAAAPATPTAPVALAQQWVSILAEADAIAEQAAAEKRKSQVKKII